MKGPSVESGRSQTRAVPRLPTAFRLTLRPRTLPMVESLYFSLAHSKRKKGAVSLPPRLLTRYEDAKKLKISIKADEIKAALEAQYAVSVKAAEDQFVVAQQALLKAGHPIPRHEVRGRAIE